MSIKYSIIMVTYNHEKYISKAIESVRAQKTPYEFEILIGDDGSKDNTPIILKDYELKYSYIHAFIHENVGLSQNVYDLFLKAQGEYIAVLEGDDYWIDNDKLEKQRALIEQNNCIATACNSLKVDEDGNKIGLWNNRKKSKILSNADFMNYQTLLWHPSAVMFKNIFRDGQDKYKVIAEASRMGGNHSGMINLLANNGRVYLDINPMTIWLSVQKAGATNYSSQKVDNLTDYYDAMKKYEYYNNVFDFDYSRLIFQYYHLSKRKIYKEAIDNTGLWRFYAGMISYYFHAFLWKIGIMNK